MFIRTKTHVTLPMGFLQISAKLLKWIAYEDIFIIFHVSSIFLLSPLFLYLVYWSAIYSNKVIYHKQQHCFTSCVKHYHQNTLFCLSQLSKRYLVHIAQTTVFLDKKKKLGWTIKKFVTNTLLQFKRWSIYAAYCYFHLF